MTPADDSLAVRPPVLEGDYIDPETVRVFDVYGLRDGITVLLNRRLQRQIMREFLTPQAPVDLVTPKLPRRKS